MYCFDELLEFRSKKTIKVNINAKVSIYLQEKRSLIGLDTLIRHSVASLLQFSLPYSMQNAV